MARSPKVQLVIDGKDNTKNAFGAIDKSLGALEKRTASVGKAMAGAFAGLVSIATLKRIADINMEFRELDKVLRQNTGSLEEFNFAQDETSRIADELGVSLDQVVNNFGKVNGSLAALGYSSRDSLKMVETISKLMSLEGADPGPTIARFNRAMSKGELHGARFNLMLQDQPALLDLIAEATGKTIAELRAMSEAGELTAEIMGDSLLQMGTAIDERFNELPKTIEQATTRIKNNIAEAFRDEELMQPVVDSLNSLADTLKDPDVQSGLANLAAGMAGAVKTGAGLAAEFGALGQQAGYWAASLSGQVTELDRLEAEIKDVDRALKASFLTRPIRYLGTSDEELSKIRAQLEKQKEAVINDMTGTTAAMREAEEQRQRELAAEKEKEMAIHRKYVNDLKKANNDAIKAVEDRGKELAKAEKDAAKKVLDAKKEAETLLKQFDDIRKDIAGGGDKEPSFADYQALATSARQALAAGDTRTAKEDALAAANLLKELAAAGENTFGFQGLVKSMQDVAKSATDIEQSNAEAELEKIKAEMAELAEQAAALKEMPVSMQADEESLESVKNQITAILEKLKVEAVIPVRMETSGAAPSANPVPAFAEGGWTGPGSKYKFAGFVHADEHVQPKRIVREPGALQFLEEVRRNGFRNTINRINNMQISKLDTGGLAEQVANIEPRQPQSVGTLNFNLPGGESFSVNTVGDFSEDLRRAALKYGKPRR
ncbi:MAG: tape measure protein [Gammaproteobacteria bacterium]|nr:tape measure protein [Gammaproteobacteria bacterium]